MATVAGKTPVTQNPVTDGDDDLMRDPRDSDSSGSEEEERRPTPPSAGPSRTPVASNSTGRTEESPGQVLKRQGKQLKELRKLVDQLTAQLMATPNERRHKPKMPTPEKYEGGRAELRAFLTNIDLYCGFNEVPNDQEKILTAGLHMKGRAAVWMQPYTEDYLRSPLTCGTKPETQKMFFSWIGFREEMGRIFGEVDAENQAEKAITRLKQTKSVSAYTAEFEQLRSRIDWDDAALRTAFENGLKDSVKDGLVHHEKPKDLHTLVALATRIDNRLWERAQQKKGMTVPTANTKKYRKQFRTDREGDVIMTDKVHEKGRTQKGKRWRQDGLTKEERQKRFDSKACLKCGKEGHFARECPDKETTKQGLIKIKMIRSGTLYPKDYSSDDTPSDQELYEEARMLEGMGYEIVPRTLEAPDVIERDQNKPIDWTVTSAEVLLRLAEKRCWVCGEKNHIAEGCARKGRVAITGPRAEETAYQAIYQQPYFEDTEALDEPKVPERKTPEHKKLHWTECQLKCRVHKEQRKATGRMVTDEWHEVLTDKECRVNGCPIHKTRKEIWPITEEDENHIRIHWTFCTNDSCEIHYDAKNGAGYFPRKTKGKGKQSKN